MKLLNDFLPLILFFIAYQFGEGEYLLFGEPVFVQGIYAATAVLIVATLVQVGLTWLFKRTLEKMHLVTLALVVVLGGATLALQSPDFIMWKPTVVNWLFAAGFVIAKWYTRQTLLERLMGKHIAMPSQIWTRLNLAWIWFFVLSGIANLYVAYHFSEAFWVNFKVFGMLGITLLFIIAQTLYLSRHAKEIEKTEES